MEGAFNAVHTHTVTSADLLAGSNSAAAYEALAADRGSYTELIGQLCWRPVAEVEFTPEILLRAVANINEAGAHAGPAACRSCSRA